MKMLQESTGIDSARVRKLQWWSDRLSTYSLGILDNLIDQEEARQLLMSCHGQIATVGTKKKREISLLDLAIDFNNIEWIVCAFATPRRACRILSWRARSADWTGTLTRFGQAPLRASYL